MKRCPTCQKTYADTMKFCQTDGTPLVEDQASQTPPADPYKTIVGSSLNDDAAKKSEPYDPMKTMVSSSGSFKSDEPKKESAESGAKSEPEKSASSSKPLDLPSNPPAFGESSSKSSSDSSTGEPSKSRPFDATFSSIEPPAFGSSNKGSTSPFDKPSSAPFGSSSKDEPPPTAFGGSPFETPKPSSTAPPPYKEPEPFNPGGAAPFGASSSSKPSDPWGTPPQAPYSSQSNDPFGSPQFGGQNDWTPPPAPVSNWQDQGLGANTPFQPPVAAGGQNQTLAIVSLVTGILSCLCCFSIITGPAALITGFLARKNATTNPNEYTGAGLAMAGMITGGIGFLIGTAAMIFQILAYLGNR